VKRYQFFYMVLDKWHQTVIVDYPTEAMRAQQEAEYVLGLPCYIKEIVK